MSFRRRMRRLPLSAVRLRDEVWATRQRTLVETTLPHIHAELETSGRLENLRRAARRESGGFRGLFFDDSDVYKWLEACAYGLVHHPSAEVSAQADAVIATLVAAQMEDGYLDSYFQLVHPERRWRDLGLMHEMYCAGHLIEAAVAWGECHGRRDLLEVATRFADLLDREFGPEGRVGYCGHEEVELALVRLADHTGVERYRELARRMVDLRGHRPSPLDPAHMTKEDSEIWPDSGPRETPYLGEYCQDHLPYREQRDIVGHAVRAMYLAIAATELADGQDDEAAETATRALWSSLVDRRLYVTGGLGASARNEGFTSDYDLPNLDAYAETCAAVGLALWGRSLLEATGESDFADVVERALYNGALAGISPSGDRFFYANPLESDGRHARTPWFGCACCPPNIARAIGRASDFLLSESDEAVWIHVPAALEADTAHGPLRVTGGYPWDGKIEVRFDSRGEEVELRFRIPAWTDDVEFDLAGEEEADFDAGYAVFRRVWRADEPLRVDLGLAPRWVEANPRVRANLGRVALTAGPVVFCAESRDNDRPPQYAQVDVEGDPRREAGPDGLPGPSYVALAVAQAGEFPDALYAPVGTGEEIETELRFVPYALWNSRGPGDMQVWVRRLG